MLHFHHKTKCCRTRRKPLHRKIYSYSKLLCDTNGAAPFENAIFGFEMVSLHFNSACLKSFNLKHHTAKARQFLKRKAIITELVACFILSFSSFESLIFCIQHSDIIKSAKSRLCEKSFPFVIVTQFEVLLI